MEDTDLIKTREWSDAKPLQKAPPEIGRSIWTLLPMRQFRSVVFLGITTDHKKHLASPVRLKEKERVNVRFLLGPAGVGKTHHCLAEIASALEQDPQGPPLILLVPKQATYQLERRLLFESGLPGYTRLRILSFERLAEFLLDTLDQPCPSVLDEEGRVMVLYSLLCRERPRLELFHASARLPGFSRQLSDLLRELQRSLQSPSRLTTIAGSLETGSVLARKLRDLALLLQCYRDWLRANGLEDSDGLLDAATGALRNWPLRHATAARLPMDEQADLFESSAESSSQSVPRVEIARLWLDGFAEMTAQELNLLVALAPFCGDMTLAFCLEEAPEEPPHWLSPWSVVGRTFHECHERLGRDRENIVSIEVLARVRDRNRFAQSPVLFHLESHWNRPEPWRDAGDSGDQPPSGALRVMECKDAGAEAVEAARAIRRFVREGHGQYRDIAVLVRRLEDYHDVLRRVLTR
jgi:ATP-dependent helicase/nuclease subunit B